MKNSNKYLDHKYGLDITILNSSLALSLLAELGRPETDQPYISELVKSLYQILFQELVDEHFPKVNVSVPTRMIEQHPEGVYQGMAIDRELKVVTVDLARAGTLPSQVCYEKLNYLLIPKNVRQDHIYISRTVNEKGEVTGASMSGSKIGGDVDQAIVIFPDPMGATGGTITEVYNYYRTQIKGTSKLMVAMHLIVTPEYIKQVTKKCPGLKVIALRLDRGLSSAQVLGSIPGTFLDQEKGLNSIDYIVPGAGGLGEILNNSFV